MTTAEFLLEIVRSRKAVVAARQRQYDVAISLGPAAQAPTDSLETRVLLEQAKIALYEAEIEYSKAIKG